MAAGLNGRDDVLIWHCWRTGYGKHHTLPIGDSSRLDNQIYAAGYSLLRYYSVGEWAAFFFFIVLSFPYMQDGMLR